MEEAQSETIEDAIEHLIFLRKIREGLKQSQESKGALLDEVEAKIKCRRQLKRARRHP